MKPLTNETLIEEENEVAFKTGMLCVYEAVSNLLHYRKSKVFTGYIVSPEAYDFLRKELLKVSYKKYKSVVKELSNPQEK